MWRRLFGHRRLAGRRSWLYYYPSESAGWAPGEEDGVEESSVAVVEPLVNPDQFELLPDPRDIDGGLGNMWDDYVGEVVYFGGLGLRAPMGRLRSVPALELPGADFDPGAVGVAPPPSRSCPVGDWARLVSRRVGDARLARLSDARSEVLATSMALYRFRGIIDRVVRRSRSTPRPAAVDVGGRAWRMVDWLPDWVRSFGRDASERVSAGRVTAAFLTLSCDEFVDEPVQYRARLRDLVCSWMGGRHAVRHRACRRWSARMRLLRVLREKLLFDSVAERRVRSPVNEAWVAVCARKLVSQSVERGEIMERQARWFKDALVTVFFLDDRDDEFFRRIAVAEVGRIE
jgi:hypothetical protein